MGRVGKEDEKEKKRNMGKIRKGRLKEEERKIKKRRK